jgi:hypothetical protein
MQQSVAIDTLGKLRSHGYRLFGWCLACSRKYDPKLPAEKRQPAMFSIDLDALIKERGEHRPIVGLSPVTCPRCGSRETETRLTPY